MIDVPSEPPASARQSTLDVLFPVMVKGNPVGLIYAGRPGPGDITIPEKELSLLKSLSNQAVLAIRQSL